MSAGHAPPHAGTVARAKDDGGRWRGRVMVAGRVYTVSSTKSRADCRRLLNAKIAAVLHPDFVPPPRRGTPVPAPPPVPPAALTLGAYLAEWLTAKRATVRSATTLTSYEGVVRRWLVPQLGERVVESLRPDDLRALYARLEATGLARSTVRLCHVVLRAALNDAQRDGRCAVHPPVLVTRAPAARRRPHAWPSADALARLVEIAADDERFGAAIVLAAYSGLRVGEILGLSVDDVDLDAGLVRLDQQLGPDGARRQLKTEASRRVVRIDPVAVAALRQRLDWRERARVAAKRSWLDRDGLIFTTATGAPLYPIALRRALRRALDAAGLPAMRFHALRHGHAMALRSAGVDLETIKDRLGHTDIKTTSGFYLHPDAALDADASERFGRLIDERRAARRRAKEGA